jgi:hypothetical protein
MASSNSNTPNVPNIEETQTNYYRNLFELMPEKDRLEAIKAKIERMPAADQEKELLLAKVDEIGTILQRTLRGLAAGAFGEDPVEAQVVVEDKVSDATTSRI